jgi:hypothetical protein
MVASLLTPLTGGLQDSHLSTNTTISPFIYQWRPTSRFGTQWHRIDFTVAPDFGKKSIITIPIKGHLVARVYFVCYLPDITATNTVYGYSAGHKLIENARIMIGGTDVDRLDSRLLEMLDEFGTPREKVSVVDKLIGRNDSSGRGRMVYIPLPFWFSTNDPHLWYPIDAVNIDKLQAELTIRKVSDLLNSVDEDGNIIPLVYGCSGAGGGGASGGGGGGTGGGADTDPLSDYHLEDPYLLVEYIYLDTYEANRLRVSNIEIPIIINKFLPVHDTGEQADMARVPLTINNPTKAILFCASRPDSIDLMCNSTSATMRPTRGGPVRAADEPVREMALVYENNQTRYHTTFMSLFRTIMPALECRKAPIYNNYFYYLGFDIGNHERRRGIPCGEANLDRISAAELRLRLRCGSDGVMRYNIHSYALIYNILHIYGGRAALLFAT